MTGYMDWLEKIGLKVLELRGEILAGVFLTCSCILVLGYWEYPFARDLSKETFAWIFVIAVLSFFLMLGQIGKLILDAITAWRKKRVEHSKALEFQKGVFKFLDTLSAQEREVLSYLVIKNQQSFNADMTAKVVVTLQQKNLIAIGAGVMSQRNAAYIIPPFVWDELQKRKSEFSNADLSGPYPWRESWMEQ